MVQIERTSSRSYRITGDLGAMVLTQAMLPSYRWALFYEGDDIKAENVVGDWLTEQEALGGAILAITRTGGR